LNNLIFNKREEAQTLTHQLKSL